MSVYLEQKLSLHCSLAMFGIKSANLISISLDECPNLIAEITELNKNHNPKLCFRILKIMTNRCLILVYRRQILEDTIFNDDVYKYLISHGYPKVKNLELYLKILTYKIKNDETFPHEIGVFLGYDLLDTIEFEKGNKNCLYVGYWKVYSNVEEKLLKFEYYNKFKEKILNLLDKGYHLENLI